MIYVIITLSNRRHYCRKCHVSLYNKCHQTIISDGAPRQYSSSSSNIEMDVVVSGKAHTLVISGKLPHWRNWCNINYHPQKHSFTTSHRSAVGRITV